MSVIRPSRDVTSVVVVNDNVFISCFRAMIKMITTKLSQYDRQCYEHNYHRRVKTSTKKLCYVSIITAT